MKNRNRDVKAAKEREENAAWMLEYLTGREVILMPSEYCKFDFLLAKQRNGVRIATSIAEYRSRPNVRIGQYPTLSINKEKIDSMREFAIKTGVEAYLFVEWADTPLMYVNVRWGKWNVTEGFCRTDKERENDRPETVYEIPIEQFREVKMT